MSTIFPKWTNQLPNVILGGGLSTLALVVGGFWYYATPKFFRVGYMPQQPALTVDYEDEIRRGATGVPQVPGVTYPGFSHQIHAGMLGLDCRYCHSNVEKSPEANIPSVSTCMGCHAEGRVDENLYAKTDRVKFIRDAWDRNETLKWRRIHKLPDYVRNFPHNVHISAGVSCFSCHGNVMEQTVVHQVEALSMGWCLECHRNPEPHLVPKDKVTDLYWVRQQFERTGLANTATGEVEGDYWNRLMAAEQRGQSVAVDSLKDAGGVFKGSTGGAALLEQLKLKQLHLLPSNCGACHF